MEIEFTLKAEEDIYFWTEAGNKIIQKKIGSSVYLVD
jgi:Txe/YoeB family toxin of Txe-Axe toxin-antitoxin module